MHRRSVMEDIDDPPVDGVGERLRAAAQRRSDAAPVALGGAPAVHAFDPDRARTMLSVKTPAEESA